jgi:hypothetical protein
MHLASSSHLLYAITERHIRCMHKLNYRGKDSVYTPNQKTTPQTFTRNGVSAWCIVKTPRWSRVASWLDALATLLPRKFHNIHCKEGWSNCLCLKMSPDSPARKLVSIFIELFQSQDCIGISYKIK